MDRALKERTIGAVVLVLLAVLVVPVFLDGPSRDADIVSEPVVLPGQNDQPRRQQTIVLTRDRDEPVPAPSDDRDPAPVAADASGATPATTSAEPPARPEAAPETVTESATVAADKSEAAAVVEREPPAPRPKPDPVPADGLWAVQLGSFSDRNNAEKLAAELRGAGYAAFLSQLDANAGALHRVRVGPQRNRAAAEEVAGTLAGAGLKGQVVPHP